MVTLMKLRSLIRPSQKRMNLKNAEFIKMSYGKYHPKYNRVPIDITEILYNVNIDIELKHYLYDNFTVDKKAMKDMVKYLVFTGAKNAIAHLVEIDIDLFVDFKYTLGDKDIYIIM